MRRKVIFFLICLFHGVFMINENEMGQDSMMPENAAVLSDFDLTEQTLLEYGDVLEDLEPLTFSTLTLSPFCCGVDTFENIYTNINGYAEVVEPWLDLGITSYISKVTVAWIQDWYVFKIEVTYTGVETGQEITLTAKSGDKSDLRETRGGTYFTNTLFLEEGEYISQVLIEGFGVMSYIELKTNTGKVLEGGVRVDVLTTSLELLVQNSAVVAFSINVGPEEWILGLEVYYVNLEDAPLEYVPPPVPEYLTIIEYPEQTLLPDEVELTPMCRGPLYYEEAPYHIEDEFVEIVDQWYEEELDPVIKEIHIYIVAELFVYQMDVHYQNSLGEEYIIIHKGAEQEKVSPNREYLISF